MAMGACAYEVVAIAGAAAYDVVVGAAYDVVAICGA